MNTTHLPTLAQIEIYGIRGDVSEAPTTEHRVDQDVGQQTEDIKRGQTQNIWGKEVWENKGGL